MSSRSKVRLPVLRSGGEPPSRSHNLSRVLIALCLAAGLAAAGYSLWFWRQSSRPGMTHYLKGMDYADARQYGQARDEWQRGVQEDPSFPQCWVQLADFNAEIRQYREAARCYEAASKLLPNDGAVFLGLARMDQALNDTKAAASAAQRAVVLLPENADAQALYGRSEYDLRNLPVALAAMRRANQLRPSDPVIVRELVHQEMNLHDTAAAVHDLTPYVQAYPQDAEAAYLMALIALAKPPTPDNLQTGLRYARSACAGEPGDLDCLSVLGQLYLNADQPQKALQTYLAGEKIAPYSEKILSGLVASYMKMGNGRAAAAKAAELQQISLRHNDLRHFLEFLRLNPTDITARLRYAQLLEADGQIRPAQIQYERVVRDAPRDPRAHPALAAFLRRMGFPDRARQAERPDFVP